MPKALSTDEALKLVPGVKIDNQWNGENVHLSIRGQGILSETGLRGTAVLLDGLPLSTPGGFVTDLYDVDWESVSNVEVMRGPAASLYGGGATAGVLNITTQNYLNTPLTGNAFLSYGSHNFWKGFGQFGGNIKNVDYRISLSRAASSGYRDHEGFWSDNIYGKAGLKISKNFEVSPIIGYTEYYQENPEGMTWNMMDSASTQANPDALTFNEQQYTKRFFAGLTGKLDFAKQHEINFYGYGKNTTYKEAFPDQVLHDAIFTPGGGIQYTLSTGSKNKIKNKLSIGGDFEYQKTDRYSYGNLGGAIEDIATGFLANETFKQTSIGGFLVDRMEFSPKWSVMLNVRYDNVDYKLIQNQTLVADSSGNGELKFNKPTGKIGITFLPNKILSIFGNFGTGFIPPGTSELGANPENIYGGFNTNLVPATSQGGEIGFREAYKDKLYIDLTGFYLMTDKDFNRFRVPDRPLETFYNNAGGSKRYGAELYAKWRPFKILTIQVAYTYSHFTYTNIPSGGVEVIDSITNASGNFVYPNALGLIQNGNWLPNSPQHQLITDIEVSPVPSLSFGVGSETYSKWYIDGTNLEDGSGLTNGYTLFNAKASYKFKVAGTFAEISLYAKNLSNKLYPAFTEPDTGGNSYHPGPKFEFFGDLRVGF